MWFILLCKNQDFVDIKAQLITLDFLSNASTWSVLNDDLNRDERSGNFRKWRSAVAVAFVPNFPPSSIFSLGLRLWRKRESVTQRLQQNLNRFVSFGASGLAQFSIILVLVKLYICIYRYILKQVKCIYFLYIIWLIKCVIVFRN